MNIVIGGGSGFIGCHLSKALRAKGFNVTLISRVAGTGKITWKDVERNGLPEKCSAVVNLAGKNILDPSNRWNESFKSEVFHSRIDTTKTLSQAIIGAEDPPKVFVSMSGVGYYEPHPSKEYTEESICEPYDFLSDLVSKWEESAQLPSSSLVRQVIYRSGVVLGKDGGMIKNIYLPFYLGLGGPIGSGSQWFPWIHIADTIGIILHAITNENVSGVLNGVAPEAATNREFTKAFGSALWRPTIIPLPSFVVNSIFGEERAKIILDGQKVLPTRTMESGYSFLYPDVKSACQSLV